MQYAEALERALGDVVADMTAKTALAMAKSEAAIAGLQTRLAEAEAKCIGLEAALKQRADDALARIGDEARSLVASEVGRVRIASDAMAKAVAEEVKSQVSAASESLRGLVPDMSPIIARIEAVEAREMPAVIHGKDAVLPDIAGMVKEAVGSAVSAIELPDVRAMVAEAVSAIPAPKDGKDADPEVVRAMIAEAMPDRESLRGPPGRLGAVKVWEDRVHYDGDVVTHAGSTYQALKDTGREPPHADWVCLAARGLDGRSPEPRGTFDETAEYRHLDIVAMNGGSFIALQDSPGMCPGDGWQLLAGRGKPGQAIKGDKGDRGESVRGPAGLPVVAGDVDDDGVVTLTNGDGSTVTIDLYPVLSRIAG